MPYANLILWWSGVVLQTLLLLVLFGRGIARRFPIFTMLIGYYLVRAVFLSALAGHLTRSAYRAIFDSLSLADICLQILVAGEIAVHILRGIRRRAPLRAATLTPLAAACLVAAAIAAMLPRRGVAPVDRGSAFPLLLMILFYLWSEFARSARAVRRIAGGFAVYGVVAVGAQVIRNYAALHHNATLWRAAAYGRVGVYLAVVVFWLVAFAACPKSTTQQEAAHA
jgi:hypothetical protein